MQNISVELNNSPGALANFGEILGSAGVSLEGGGVFAVGQVGIANFLVRDAELARRALEQAGVKVTSVNEVVVVRLNQDESGQLGKLARHMANAGVNIEVQYSDHENQLILVVDDAAKARIVADTWRAGAAI